MNWFRNLKVTYKILLSCLLFIVMIISIVLFSITSMKKIESSVVDYRENSVIPIIKMGKFVENLARAKITMLEARIDNSAEGRKRFATEAKSIRENNITIVKILTERSMTNEEKATTETFQQRYAEIGKTLASYLEAVNRGDDNQALYFLDLWTQQYNGIKESILKLEELSTNVGVQRITDSFTQMKMVITYILIILGFSVVLGFIITVILGKSISNPVQKGLVFAQKIAEGDFTERIDLKQDDELGLLSNALNQAADKLENTVSDIIDASNNLAQAVEQIASGNQTLSQRTSEQASSLEEIAATIEEANSSINQNYENSNQAKQMSEASSSIANQGGELVQEAVRSINEVNSSAKKIGEITNVINDIAFQTNLLALNAAVEAARAGDQGRGFAVVAGEVRNLAQRAGNAAKEIAHLISDTVAKVEDGTEKTYKSGDSLKEIIESVNNVARFVSEISASSKEQKQGIDQISTAITDLDSMTQHNAAMVEETASASEEMANQAQELMGLMSTFRIRSGKSIDQGNMVVKKATPAKPVIHDSGKNGAKPANATGKKPAASNFENEGYEKF